MKLLNFKTFFILILALLTINLNSFAKENLKDVFIKTNVFSFMCKDKVERAVKELKGVEEAYLSLEDKILEVKYESKVVTENDILKTIIDLGYEAEIVKGENIKEVKEISTDKRK